MFRQAVLVLSCSEADCVLRPSGAQCHQVADPRGLPALTGGGAGKTRRLNTPLADGDQVLGWDSSIRRAGTAAQPPERCSTARLLPPGDGRARRRETVHWGPPAHRTGAEAVRWPGGPTATPRSVDVTMADCSPRGTHQTETFGGTAAVGRPGGGQPDRTVSGRSAPTRRPGHPTRRASTGVRRSPGPAARSDASDGRCPARPGR